MFDIGFWELGLIGVIALIVVGPERLPGLARNIGGWIGKGKRLINSVQSDINREINKAEELKNLLNEQKKIVEKHEIIEELKKELPTGSQPVSKPSGSKKNTKKIPGNTTVETEAATVEKTDEEKKPGQQHEQ